MEPINSLLMGVQEKLGGVSGLIRECCDTKTYYNSRLIKRASARIYIGGDDYYCQFLKELAKTEIKKDIKDRGVALLFVDNKSMKKISSTTIAGASLKEKLVELGVELLTAKKILSFHGRNGRSLKDYKNFYSAMGKIKFNNDDRSESEIRRIESVARKARLTLQAENYKYLIPEFVFANYDVTIVSVIDLDTRAPLVPQNIAKEIIANSSNTLTLSAFMHGDGILKTHLIDNDIFHTLSEIEGVDTEVSNLGMLKKMHPIGFKPDYSFIEFRKYVSSNYTDAVFNCFVDNYYNHKIWHFQQGEQLTRGRFLSVYDKAEDFTEIKFDGVFLSSEKGMPISVNPVGHNKAEFFRTILAFHNACMVNQKVHGLMGYIHEIGLHKKVKVCSDDLSTNVDVFPRDYCRKVTEKNSKKIIFNFHGSKILILGYKDDVVRAISGVMSSPCRDWNITSTIGNVSSLRWDYICGNNCEVTVPCLRAGNTLTKFGDVTNPSLALSNNVVSFDQPIDHSLLPVELSYFQCFVNGGVFGGVSFLMDKFVGEKVVRQCPRLKTLYQLGRNVLFGGPVFGSFQTVFSQVCDRLLFHETHETSTQSWRRSTAEFCLRNGLLFIPVVQGAAIPAVLSMTGAMSSQYVLRKIIHR